MHAATKEKPASPAAARSPTGATLESPASDSSQLRISVCEHWVFEDSLKSGTFAAFKVVTSSRGSVQTRSCWVRWSVLKSLVATLAHDHKDALSAAKHAGTLPLDALNAWRLGSAASLFNANAFDQKWLDERAQCMEVLLQGLVVVLRLSDWQEHAADTPGVAQLRQLLRGALSDTSTWRPPPEGLVIDEIDVRPSEETTAAELEAAARVVSSAGKVGGAAGAAGSAGAADPVPPSPTPSTHGAVEEEGSMTTAITEDLHTIAEDLHTIAEEVFTPDEVFTATDAHGFTASPTDYKAIAQATASHILDAAIAQATASNVLDAAQGLKLEGTSGTSTSRTNTSAEISEISATSSASVERHVAAAERHVAPATFYQYGPGTFLRIAPTSAAPTTAPKAPWAPLWDLDVAWRRSAMTVIGLVLLVLGLLCIPVLLAPARPPTGAPTTATTAAARTARDGSHSHLGLTERHSHLGLPKRAGGGDAGGGGGGDAGGGGGGAQALRAAAQKLKAQRAALNTAAGAPTVTATAARDAVLNTARVVSSASAAAARGTRSATSASRAGAMAAAAHAHARLKGCASTLRRGAVLSASTLHGCATRAADRSAAAARWAYTLAGILLSKSIYAISYATATMGSSARAATATAWLRASASKAAARLTRLTRLTSEAAAAMWASTRNATVAFGHTAAAAVGQTICKPLVAADAGHERPERRGIVERPERRGFVERPERRGFVERPERRGLVLLADLFYGPYAEAEPAPHTVCTSISAAWKSARNSSAGAVTSGARLTRLTILAAARATRKAPSWATGQAVRVLHASAVVSTSAVASAAVAGNATKAMAAAVVHALAEGGAAATSTALRGWRSIAAAAAAAALGTARATAAGWAAARHGAQHAGSSCAKHIEIATSSAMATSVLGTALMALGAARKALGAAVAVESALDTALLDTARALTPGVVLGAVLGGRAVSASGRAVTVVTGSIERRIEAIGGVLAAAVNVLAAAVNGVHSMWRDELSARCPCLGCPCAQL